MIDIHQILSYRRLSHLARSHRPQAAFGEWDRSPALPPRARRRSNYYADNTTIAD